jgi:integrase
MRQRANGAWELRAFLGRDPLTGKDIYKSRSVHGGKREAQRALTAFLAELDRTAGAPLGAAGTTVGQLIATHLERFEGSPLTLRNYHQAANKYILPYLASTPIGLVTPALIDSLYDRILADHDVSAATIHKAQAILRGAFRRAVKWGWVTVNPVRDATAPRIPKPELVMPTADGVMRAMAEADRMSPAIGMFVRLAAATGARRGELVALTWGKIDIDSGTVRIDKSAYSPAGGGTALKDTKNHTRRSVGIDAETVGQLREHRRAAVAGALAVGVALSEDAFVFSNDPTGVQAWRVDTVTHTWQQIRDAVGLDGVRLHDLRHFQATMLLQAGIPVTNVSKRIGHRDSATTLNVYGHHLEQTDQHAAAVMGSMLTPTPAPAKKRTRRSNA